MDAEKRYIQNPGRYGLFILVLLIVITPLVWLIHSGDKTAVAAPALIPQQTYQVQRVADINQFGLSSLPEGPVELDGRLYFRADDGIHLSELWMFDPDEMSAALVADIHPFFRSIPDSLVVLDGKLYFSASDHTGGRELWVMTRLYSEGDILLPAIFKID